jgi:membrane protease YdiL (CAAX protease family)
MKTTLTPVATPHVPMTAPGIGWPLVILVLPSALGVAGFALTSGILRVIGIPGTPGNWANLWTTLAVYPLCLLALWLRARRGGMPLTAQIGFRRECLPRDLLLGIAVALLGFLVSAVSGVAANMVIYTAEQRAAFMEALRNGTPPIATVVMPHWYGWFSLLLQPLAAALVEELLYRGHALQGLRARVGAAGAVVLSALAFGLQHWAFTPLDWQFGLTRMVSLGAVGMVFGIIALRQARLLPLIIGHALWNVVLIGLPALMATLRSAQ